MPSSHAYVLPPAASLPFSPTKTTLLFQSLRGNLNRDPAVCCHSVSGSPQNSSRGRNIADLLSSTPTQQNFRGQHGKAYLFNAVVNISQSDATERNMTTGRHIVRDIMCRQCKETVGWKYDKAYEPSEKYKEGKFILEAELLCTVY